MGCNNPGRESMDIQSSDTYRNELRIGKVKQILSTENKDWVLFKFGTFLVLEETDSVRDVKTEATKRMKELGPVEPGTPSGDFRVKKLTNPEGWLVSFYWEGMYAYVSPEEMENKIQDDIHIGIAGRNKRQFDGENPVVIYVNETKKRN